MLSLPHPVIQTFGKWLFQEACPATGDSIFSTSFEGSTYPKDAASSPNLAVSQAFPHDWYVHLETHVLGPFMSLGSFTTAENFLPKISLCFSVCQVVSNWTLVTRGSQVGLCTAAHNSQRFAARAGLDLWLLGETTGQRHCQSPQGGGRSSLSVPSHGCSVCAQRSSEAPGHVSGPSERKLRSDGIFCSTPAWVWRLCFLLCSLVWVCRFSTAETFWIIFLLTMNIR